MVVSKEILTDLKEKFEKAYKLIDEESKDDPPTEPYRSHYAAGDVLTEMMKNLKNLINSEENTANQFTYQAILAFVYKDLGRIKAFTDEIKSGETYLQNCLDLLEDHKLQPEAIIPLIGALNELGIIWCNRENSTESKKYLDKAEALYFDFKNTERSPLTITDIFGTAEEVEKGKGAAELEKLYTLTTFYMAQVMAHLGDLEKSANYCNTTLKRQLEAKEYEPIDWALNAATLSQYFLTPNRMTDSRHHLAAATCILAEYETKMITPGMSEETQATVQENFKHRYADIARCWAKYGLCLLSASKDRLMADDNEGKDKETDTLEKDIDKLAIKDSFRFESLDLIAYETGVSDQYCLTFEDAKLVYHFVVMWLDRAKEYYTADTEATEYSKIITDYADLYKYLAFFDDIPANQCKLQKKRADHLEDLLQTLNPTYYLTICRECHFGCGLSYCAMLDIKLDALSQLKIDETPTPHALHKINTLCDKAIKHFKSFIDSYKSKETGEIPKTTPPDEMQAVLHCYFHIGRLFYKIITPDKIMLLQNLQSSLKYYKMFVDECEINPEASAELKPEIGVCKEMVTLIPLKVIKVQNEIKNQ